MLANSNIFSMVSRYLLIDFSPVMDHIILLLCTPDTFIGCQMYILPCWVWVNFVFLYLFWTLFCILGHSSMCESLTMNPFDPLGSCMKDSSGRTRATFSLELIYSLLSTLPSILWIMRFSSMVGRNKEKEIEIKQT